MHGGGERVVSESESERKGKGRKRQLRGVGDALLISRFLVNLAGWLER